MRYVRPQANAVRELFLKLARLPGKQILSAEWAQVQGRCKNPVQLQLPLTSCTGKLLIIK
jgi:hypothetical protein